MVVVERGTGEDGAVRMQSGACYWGRAGLVQEARVRFKGGEVEAVDVEGLDFVAVCATSAGLATGSARWKPAGKVDIH